MIPHRILKNKKLKKTIGITGSFHSDICIYTAAVLSNLGMGVMVCDMTKDREIMSLFPDFDVVPLSYMGADYIRGYDEKLIQSGSYSCIIIFADSKTPKEYLTKCSELYMVTGCDRRTVEDTCEYMRKTCITMNLIIRNICPGEDRYKILDILKEENAFVTDSYFLPFDAIDEGYRVAMQYKNVTAFKELSPQFAKLLGKICLRISGASRTDVGRAYYLAKKGVSICA